MALRRDLGNRQLPSAVSKRTGPDYLVAHACFSCRRSFKIAPRDEESPSARCPGCGGILHWMGRTFRAPRQGNREQWLKVQLLFAHGFRFTGSGSLDGPPLPGRLREVDEFVRANPTHPLRTAGVDRTFLRKALGTSKDDRRADARLSSTVAKNQIFRLPGSVKRDPAVRTWMKEHSGELGAIARDWFEVMRKRGKDVRELLHDGHPTACVADAAFAYVDAFKAHVNVGFFRGAELADPAGLLEGTGKYMRHVKLRPDGHIDAAALIALVESAYTDMKRRLSG